MRQQKMEKMRSLSLSSPASTVVIIAIIIIILIFIIVLVIFAQCAGGMFASRDKCSRSRCRPEKDGGGEVTVMRRSMTRIIRVMVTMIMIMGMRMGRMSSGEG